VLTRQALYPLSHTSSLPSFLIKHSYNLEEDTRHPADTCLLAPLSSLLYQSSAGFWECHTLLRCKSLTAQEGTGGEGECGGGCCRMENLAGPPPRADSDKPGGDEAGRTSAVIHEVCSVPWEATWGWRMDWKTGFLS
jgi:hypothetical protein